MPDLGHKTGTESGSGSGAVPIRALTQLAVDSTSPDWNVHMQLLGHELGEVLGSSRLSRLKLVNEGSALQKVSLEEGGPWGQLMVVLLGCC
jgi:hypothetical protein